ncbi:unnamed protein product [Periconia digitata]|uniref:Uncharacterized protein n=1 Tax=Periconia digitata TaxID=1303443 RepID=A0A9W4XVN1_9PLEO|nr:unnamed protein product [Periconia digitata]
MSTKTQDCAQMMIVQANDKSVYLAESVHGAGDIQQLETGLTTPTLEDWPAPIMSGTHEVSSAASQDIKLKSESLCSDLAPTVEQTPPGSVQSAPIHSLGSPSESIRGRSTPLEARNSPDNLNSTSSFPSISSTTTFTQIIGLDGANDLDELPHKAPSQTPEAVVKVETGLTVNPELNIVPEAVVGSEAIAVPETVADTELNRLYQILGRELLSHMPQLHTMTFEEIKAGQVGILPLRMLLGTFKQSADPSLRGSKVWVYFKLHAMRVKTASAPRLYLCALREDTGVAINEDLKLLDIFPHVEFVPILRNLEPGKPGDMQLKAVVKFYYILAANAKLNGFEKHFMPINNTFTGQLRIVCEKLKADTTGEQLPPRKRRKMHHSIGDLPSPPSSEDASPSIQNSGVTRASRRLHNPSTGSLPNSPPPNPFRRARAVEQNIAPPRKLALGTILPRSRPSQGIINEYLNPDIEPAESDGDSGDEIPPRIHPQISSTLFNRRENQRMIEFSRTNLKQAHAKKESARHRMRSLKGRITRGLGDVERMQRDYHLQETCVEVIDKRIETFDGMVKGFVELKNRLDDDISHIDDGVKKVWDALQAQELECFLEEQELRRDMEREAREAARIRREERGRALVAAAAAATTANEASKAKEEEGTGAEAAVVEVKEERATSPAVEIKKEEDVAVESVESIF